MVSSHCFFQAEDGIRDLVRSRGIGDVYKRQAQGVELVSNVCRHRQAVMLKGRGHTRRNIVCPLHRWTYDLHGKLVGAPHFAEDPCLNLRSYPVQNWHGLLFEQNGRDVVADLSGLGPAAELDFSGYVFDRAVQHECDYNWKTFIAVSYTHLRAHETVLDLVCRLLLEKNNDNTFNLSLCTQTMRHRLNT